jgi:hypothetical protein
LGLAIHFLLIGFREVNDNNIRGLRTFKEKSFYRKEARAQWIFETVSFHFLLFTLLIGFREVNDNHIRGLRTFKEGVFTAKTLGRYGFSR